MISAFPDRADGVNHVACGKVESVSQLCVAGVAEAKPPARFEQARSRRPMNRPIDPTTSAQSRIGGVHHRVHLESGNVSDMDQNHVVTTGGNTSDRDSGTRIASTRAPVRVTHPPSRVWPSALTSNS